MAQQAAASVKHTTSVINYIVARLADEGIAHCFGVAGDYAFPICDAVDSSSKIKWVGCANELNASYAADGYARIRGAAMLVTTYGVGELSALNGVMGAKAERSLVFHVVGMPSYRPSHARRWSVRQFRRAVRQRSVLSRGYPSGELRRRNGARYRGGAPQQSTGLKQDHAL